MGLRTLISETLPGLFTSGGRRRPAKVPRLQIERLEDRLVLYSASGNKWPAAQVITISFVPDGTDLGGVTSNLVGAFDANPNLVGWREEILRAAQSWAQATNINFVIVPDNGAAITSGSYQQGNPNFGDIRIGGYNFGDTSLAEAFFPPPANNFAPAGDIAFNTDYAAAYNIGTSYDVYTIAAHEIGHALGLDHSTVSASQMSPVYTGVKSTLNADDIAGIRNIYSSNAVRGQDDYDKPSTNNVIGDASNITSELVRSKKWAIVTELDITSTSDVDFYKVKIPAYADGTLTVKIQSLGLSLLAPKVTLYAENQTTVLGTASSLDHGATLTLSVPGVSTGDWIYIKVQGNTTNAFGTGAYGLTLDIGASSTPVIPLPNTMKLNGSPLNAGSAVPDSFIPLTQTDTVAPTEPTIGVAFGIGKTATLVGKAEAGTLITIYQDGLAIATTTSNASGDWSFKLSRKLARMGYQFTATASDEFGNASAQSAIQIVSIRKR